MLLIGRFQQICHWFLLFVIEKRLLWNAPQLNALLSIPYSSDPTLHPPCTASGRYWCSHARPLCGGAFPRPRPLGLSWRPGHTDTAPLPPARTDPQRAGASRPSEMLNSNELLYNTYVDPCHLIGGLLVTWYSIDVILHGRAFLVICAVHFWLYADCVPLCRARAYPCVYLTRRQSECNRELGLTPTLIYL